MKKKPMQIFAIVLLLAFIAGMSACSPSTKVETATGTSNGSGKTEGKYPGYVLPPPPEIVVPSPGPDGANLTETRTKPLYLNFATGFPITHSHQVGIIDQFIKLFNEATDGMVIINVHAGGSFSAGTSIQDDLESGALDMGWGVVGWTPGRMPLTELFELPLAFKDSMELSAVFWDLYENNENLQAEHKNYKLWCFFGSDMRSPMHAKIELRRPLDWANTVIRTSGVAPETWIRATGASTVGFPVANLYDNIARNVVHGADLAFSQLINYNLIDVIKYGITNLPVYPTTHYMGMSNECYNNKLNDFERSVFDRIAGRYISELSSQYFTDEGAAVYEYFLDKPEMITLVTLTPEEIAEWNEVAFGPCKETFISTLEARGVPARETWAEVEGFIEARRAE